MSPKQIAELKEENERITRQINTLAESYRLLLADYNLVKQERDGLLDTVERLSLDLHLKDKGFIHLQD
jgi:archaellum component FlaC